MKRDIKIAEQKEICDLYVSGQSVKDISCFKQIPKQRIFYALNKNKIEMRPRVSKDQKEKIGILYKNRIPLNEITRETGVSLSTIKRVCKNLDLINRRNIIDQSKYSKICKDYLSGKTQLEISKDFDASPHQICRILKENNIKIRSMEESNRTYTCNHSYFSKIDSHKKAQILGFIAADGCVTRGGGGAKILSIGLASKDIDYLEFIKQEMEYSGPIILKTTKNKFYKYPYKNHKKMCRVARLRINSQEIFKDLLSLGIIERKSLTLQFPTEQQVPREFISSFIRGFIEGDGWIINSKTKTRKSLSPVGGIGLCLTEEFAKQFSRIIKSKLDIHVSMHRPKDAEKRNINAWKAYIGGNKNVIKFCDWMYEDAEFKMMRKFKKFLNIKRYYDDDYNLKSEFDKRKK